MFFAVPEACQKGCVREIREQSGEHPQVILRCADGPGPHLSRGFNAQVALLSLFPESPSAPSRVCTRLYPLSPLLSLALSRASFFCLFAAGSEPAREISVPVGNGTDDTFFFVLKPFFFVLVDTPPRRRRRRKKRARADSSLLSLSPSLHLYTSARQNSHSLGGGLCSRLLPPSDQTERKRDRDREREVETSRLRQTEAYPVG